MALIFRPTTRGGQSVLGRARQMAAKYGGQQGVWHGVVDGYILRAVGVPPDTLIHVIDSPVEIATFGYRSYGSGSWPFIQSVQLPNRDALLPTKVGSVTPELSGDAYPVVTTGSTIRTEVVTTFFVPASGYFGGYFAESASTMSSGEWAGGGALVRDTPTIEEESIYQAAVLLVSGRTPVELRGTEITVTSSLATQQAYIWTDTYLRSAFSLPLTMGWLAAPWSRAVATSICPELYPRPEEQGRQPRRIAVATAVSSIVDESSAHAGVVCLAIDPWPKVLTGKYLIQFFYQRVRLIKDLGIPELVATVDAGSGSVEPSYVTGLGSVIGDTDNQRILFSAYAEQVVETVAARFVSRSSYVIAMEQPSQTVTVLHSMVWANDAPSADGLGIPYQPNITFTSAFAQCSAQVVADNETQLLSYLPYNRYTGKQEMGKAYPYVAATDTDLVLMRSDGVHIVTGLRAAGLAVAVGEYNFSSNPWGVGGRLPTVLADIGNNRLIAVVVSDASSVTSHVIRVAVLDALTGEYIETRGDVATVPHSPTCQAHISCALPETMNEDDELISPAVLLVSLSNEGTLYDQYVSNDGGHTWQKYATGTPGVSYYVGNRLHPAVVTKKL